MIDTQLFHDVILVLAVLVAVTVALSARDADRALRGQARPDPRRPPHGGTAGATCRPEPQPQPDLDGHAASSSCTDRALAPQADADREPVRGSNAR